MIVKCKYTAFDNMKEWIPTLAAIIQLGKLDAGEIEETPARDNTLHPRKVGRFCLVVLDF